MDRIQAIKIIELDAKIELMIYQEQFIITIEQELRQKKEIEKLKQQKIQLYENTCNRL
jgi:hypothetical protein